MGKCEFLKLSPSSNRALYRKGLSIEITSCILFIKINGPPIDKFSPEKYLTLWLRSHQLAENKRNTGRPNDKREITKKKVGIFCNFKKLIKLLIKLFMYFTILMIFTKQNIIFDFKCKKL